ncbi:sugar ABC transporter permease [Pendulispora rubella]|uniref:Sugar ABC transporter permease n=1 Tax=Pendulispora rubella TaxID=2741070 RepID=A0ABZ2KX85_9BACT
MRARTPSSPWILLGPSLVLLVVFVVFPVGLAVYESFFQWDLLTDPIYVQIDNYRALAERRELLHLVWRTLSFSVMVVAGAMSLGLGLAVLLNRRGRLFAFARAAIFSAYVVSWVSVALLFTWLLDADHGVFAAMLKFVHLPRVGFLTDPNTALATLAGVTVWKITGYALVVFLAGLQSVPPSLLEAAALDGAGRWSRFRFVVWPLLRPTAAFVATTSLVISFQTFDVVRIMTQGGPANATSLFVYAIYEQVFLDLSIGKASAITVIFFVVLVAVASLQFRFWSASASARARGERRT